MSNIPIHQSLSEAMQRVASGNVRIGDLVELLKGETISFADSLQIVAGTEIQNEYVWKLGDHWRELQPAVNLSDLFQEMRAAAPPNEIRSFQQFERRWGFENLIYSVSLEDAKSTGLCDYIEELIETGGEHVERMLAYPAFSSRSKRKFRQWLASSLAQCTWNGAISHIVIELAIKQFSAMMDRRDQVLEIASNASFAQAHYACFFVSSTQLEDSKAIVRSALKGAQCRRDPDAGDLEKLLAILEGATNFEETSDLAWKFCLSVGNR